MNMTNPLQGLFPWHRLFCRWTRHSWERLTVREPGDVARSFFRCKRCMHVESASRLSTNDVLDVLRKALEDRIRLCTGLAEGQGNRGREFRNRWSVRATELEWVLVAVKMFMESEREVEP